MDIGKYEYQEVAMIHLKLSIELYFQKNYICSLHLATAAEEILGGMLTHKNLPNMNQLRKDLNVELNKRYGMPLLSERELSREQNLLKNAIKHFNKSDSKFLTESNIKQNARSFILKAINNYSLFFGQFPEGEIYVDIINPLSI